MAEPFNCPTCGASLDVPAGSATAVTCPFCRSTVIVPEALRHDGAQPAEGSRPSGGIPTEDENLMMHLRALLASGRKIDAIKLYRAKYFVGLKEAKDAVEAIEAGLQDSLPAATTSLPLAAGLDQAAFLTELQGLIRQGNKIEAIKRYRQVYPVGLKDALFAINGIEAGTLQTLPSPEAEAARLHQKDEAAEQAKKAGLHTIPFSIDRRESGDRPAASGGVLRPILTILLIAALIFGIGLLAVRCSGPNPEMAAPWLSVLH